MSKNLKYLEQHFGSLCIQMYMSNFGSERPLTWLSQNLRKGLHTQTPNPQMAVSISSVLQALKIVSPYCKLYESPESLCISILFCAYLRKKTCAEISFNDLNSIVPHIFVSSKKFVSI